MPLVHCTIDSVSMQHLCRPVVIKKTTKKKVVEHFGIDLITLALSGKHLRMYIDAKFSLRDEWIKTCSRDIIEPILSRWIESGGVVQQDCATHTIPAPLRNQLRKFKFEDTVDRLIVRLALVSVNQAALPFHIATNDSDFWDPLDSSKAGSPTAPIAAALRSYGVNSTQLKDFFLMIPT